jgi:hypothetical protein
MNPGRGNMGATAANIGPTDVYSTSATRIVAATSSAAPAAPAAPLCSGNIASKNRNGRCSDGHAESAPDAIPSPICLHGIPLLR